MKGAALITSFMLCTFSGVPKVTDKSLPVGKFVVASHIEDISNAPIMEAPLISRRVRLEWYSNDHRLRFFITDDGFNLIDSLEISRENQRTSMCEVIGGKLWAYQSKNNSSLRWPRLREAWVRKLAECSTTVDSTKRSAYAAEIADAAPDFAPALEAMKAFAQERFGGWRRRCLDFGHDSVLMQPFSHPCVRYSAKVN